MAKMYNKDGYYIPTNAIDQNLVTKHLDKHVYVEKGCERCEVKTYRFSSHCVDCRNYVGHVVLHRTKTMKSGRRFTIIPNGNPDWIEDKFGLDLSEVVDRRATVPMPYLKKIKFTRVLYAGQVVNGVRTVNQQRIVDEIKANDANGLVISPTRSGKTVFGVKLSLDLGLRTLILAHKIEILEQFYSRLQECTNIIELESSLNEGIASPKKRIRLAGIARKSSDLDLTKNGIQSIVMMTYQQLITPLGKKRLKELVRGKFGTLIVDEVHLANAQAFSQVVFSIDARYKIGLSAELKRKDRLEYITNRLIGPIIARGENVGLKPEVLIVDTGLKPKKDPYGYAAQMQWLSENKDRNKLLVRKTFEILRSDPNRCILIPTVRVDHCIELTRLINRQAKINNEKRGEDWSEELALEFHGKIRDRKKILNVLRDGVESGSRVAVAMRSIISTGVDVAAWTDLISSFLMANDPTNYQLMSRVCSPAKNKPQPKIHLIVDAMGITLGCFRSTFATCMRRKYIMSTETYELGKKLAENKKQLNWGF